MTTQWLFVTYIMFNLLLVLWLSLCCYLSLCLSIDWIMDVSMRSDKAESTIIAHEFKKKHRKPQDQWDLYKLMMWKIYLGELRKIVSAILPQLVRGKFCFIPLYLNRFPVGCMACVNHALACRNLNRQKLCEATEVKQ